MRRETVVLDTRMQKKQERWDRSRSKDEWEKAQRMLMRGTRTSSSTEGRAPQTAEPVQKMALLRHRLLLFLPSAKQLPHVAIW